MALLSLEFSELAESELRDKMWTEDIPKGDRLLSLVLILTRNKCVVLGTNQPPMVTLMIVAEQLCMSIGGTRSLQ